MRWRCAAGAAGPIRVAHGAAARDRSDAKIRAARPAGPPVPVPHEQSFAAETVMAETRHNIPPEFLDAADEFVQLANKYGDSHSRDWVRAVMMYATARYNAFAWVTREEDPDQSLDAAVAYYASEYDKMLRDNVDEIEPVYRAARRAQAQ